MADITTLPTVTPAAGRRVKVSLSAAEMSADNVGVLFNDVSGSEWADLFINIQTSARRIDDLAYPATSGRSTDIDASGQVKVGSTATGAITTASFAAGAINAAAIGSDAITDAKVASDVTIASVTGNVGGNVVGSVASVTAGVTVTTNNDKTGYGLSAAAVQAIWDALTSALTTVGSIGKRIADNLDAAITSRMATFVYTTPPTVVQVRTEMDSNSTKLANLDATVGSRATQVSVDDLPTNAELATSQAAADDATLAAIAALTIPSANAIADATLSRGVSNVQDTADTTSLAALILATFESSASGTTWTIRKTGGTTFVVKTLTLDDTADPVIGVT